MGQRRTRRARLAPALCLLLLLAIAPQAHAFIYWGNTGTTIGRANADGSGVNESFITGANSPCGVAVDASHLFWTNDALGTVGAGTIGRSNLDGSGVTQSLVSGGDNPCGIAVDASHVYWANNDGPGSIGRANLDGSSPNQSLIGPLTYPCGVAVDSHYVYWANRDIGTIGRANLDGSSPNSNFISTGAADLCGVAVDGSHVYWTDIASTTIGRANLDGGSPTSSFITGASHPCGVAVDTTSVYWANSNVGTIGKANLDGSGANQSLVTGADIPCFVAADVTPPPPPPPSPPPPPLAITHLRLSPSGFPAARHGTTITRKRRRRATGSFVSYNDTQAATAHLTVLSRRLGVKSGGKCVAPPRRRRGAKIKLRHCFRYVLSGTFTHADIAGTNSFHFSGRLSGKALPPGRYRLVAVPVLGTRTGTGDQRGFRIAL